MRNKIKELDKRLKNIIPKHYHVYHHNDMDGHSSGALVAIGLNEIGVKQENIHMYEMNYGLPFDDSKVNYNTDTVYMVDFSLQPVSEMLKLWNKLGDRLIWIDHHKTSVKFIKEENFKAKGVVDDGPKAACELVWEWFWPKKEKPAALIMISQYDVWNKEGRFSWDDCLLLKYGLETQITLPADSLSFWSSLMFCSDKIKEEKLKDLMSKGKIIKEFNDKRQRANTLSGSYEGIFDGKKAILVNSSEGGSIQFEVAHDVSKYEIMITYKLVKGNYWIVSLYSTNPNIDCGEIAKRIGNEGPLKGGGGHPGAAGFQTTLDHLIKIMPGFQN